MTPPSGACRIWVSACVHVLLRVFMFMLIAFSCTHCFLCGKNQSIGVFVAALEVNFRYELCVATVCTLSGQRLLFWSTAGLLSLYCVCYDWQWMAVVYCHTVL